MSSPIRLSALFATGIGANRRLILWRRQLCNHAAKGQILPEQTQIHLPVMLFSSVEVNSVGNVVHTQATDRKGIPEASRNDTERQKLGPPLSSALNALLFFKTHFKKKGKKEQLCSAHLGRTYLAKLFKVLLHIFHYCVSR